MDESRPGIFIAVLPFEITELPGDAADYIFSILLCTEERPDLPDGFINFIDVACFLHRQYFCSCRFCHTVQHFPMHSVRRFMSDDMCGLKTDELLFIELECIHPQEFFIVRH